jgi:capsular exopolysaccharide synthesis family protein
MLRESRNEQDKLARHDGRENDLPADDLAGIRRSIPWRLEGAPYQQRDAHGGAGHPGADGWEVPPARQGAVLARVASRRGGTRTRESGGGDLSRYADILRRRWTTGLVLCLIVVAGVSAGALLNTPAFRAAGLLEIRRESTGTTPMQTLFSSERVASDDLETQFGILRSGTIAGRVADQLHANPPNGLTPQEASLPASTLQKHLRISPKTGSRLVEVSFESSSPTLSAWVVNGVLDTYLQVRREEAKQSAEWLDEQLRVAKGRLEGSEDRLQSLLRLQTVEVLETGKGETAQVVNARLQTLHDAVATAQAERIQKQATAEQAGRRATTGDLDSAVLQGLNVRLADLHREHGKLSASFHEDYPAVVAVNSQIAELERAIAREFTLVVSRAQGEYQAAVRREALARQVLERQNVLVQGLEQGTRGGGGYEALKRDVVTNQAQFAVLDQKLKEVRISAALKAANVGIIDRASISAPGPASSLPTTIVLAAFVGLLFAAGGMCLQEHLDTSVRTVQDVNMYLGLPTLAAIPGPDGPGLRRLGATAGTARGSCRLIGEGGLDRSPLAEAFAALRTAVLLSDDATGPRALLVTSANSGEGKTTVSSNLAMSLARLNHRVLLIDANMRRPSLHAAFELTSGDDLVRILADGADWRSCVRTEVHRNLDVLPSSTPATSPADLLALPRMRQLISVAADEYDFLVIDAPALLAYPADVHSLASLADSVLLTVRQGVTPRAEIANALSQLARVSGVVLNGYGSRETAASRRTAETAA